MFKKAIFLLSILTIAVAGFSHAQAVKKIAADRQRATQWKPDKGQYYFSHSIVFEYEDKAENKKGEVKIYFDPVTGTLCFKKEDSFGDSGKAYDFIIAFQDGRYMHCGIEGSTKKIRTTEKVEEVKPDAETQNQQKENFNTYLAATGNKRIDSGFESVEYDLSYATSENKDKIWVAAMPFSVYPIYGFELIEVAASLPISLDYMYLLGPNQLISGLESKEATLKLKSIGADPFLAMTKNYQEIKVNN